MHWLQNRIQQIAMMVLMSSVLSGCMVGPNFRSPPRPDVDAYTETALPHKTVSTKGVGKGGKSQHFLTGKDIPPEWWYLFHSPQINELVTLGIANNETLAQSYAALRAAQEAYNVQVGSTLLPAFDAGLSGQRQRFSNASFGNSNAPASIFNVFNASVTVSYALDIFGGLRRQAEGFRAQVDYQQFQLIAAYLTITSNIVTTAITIASLQEQINITRELIGAEAGQLTILKKQFDLGGISETAVLTQQTLVEQTRATIPPLQNNLSKARHTLSVLVGVFPNGKLPDIALNSLTLPVNLPVSLPSNLVRQRPDIRASEALLHAASAAIGVATANLFPQFTITGNDGWTTDTLSKLFTSSTNVWSIGSQITQPLFHGGALFAQRRQAIALFEQANAQYKQTVLQGFQNVADALKAVELDAKELNIQMRAEKAASSNLELTKKQYFLGGANYLELLIVQQKYDTIRIARIQSQANRYTDTAALFAALGGGWWHKEWCVRECF